MNPEIRILDDEDTRLAEAWATLSPQLEALGPQAVLAWATKQFPEGLVLASSFGAEDMVLIDMLTRVTDHPVVFYLDTGLLFPETYTLIRQVEARYPLRLVRVAPALSIEEQGERLGPALWSRNPDQCCAIRKVEPLQRYLADKRAWITGIRRDQTPFRKNAPVVGFDERHGLVKINPLAPWSQKDVFRYLVKNQVPYNPLHDHGYPSIGCVPCTRPVNPGDDPRAGRWAGQEKTECGLHL
ncbi:phosphoadenylyl-sulfate reductase [Sulfobacillus harzensis]|uniref:phosphoadenylyl-sulfate reductase n=1 Tax=Sulfobacillus harzensis TaxID=2729629 RepID=UPI00308436D1